MSTRQKDVSCNNSKTTRLDFSRPQMVIVRRYTTILFGTQGSLAFLGGLERVQLAFCSCFEHLLRRQQSPAPRLPSPHPRLPRRHLGSLVCYGYPRTAIICGKQNEIKRLFILFFFLHSVRF